MARKKTTFVVEAQQKGFDQTQRKAERMFGTLGKAKDSAKDFEYLGKAGGELATSIEAIEKRYKQLERTLASRKGVQGVKELTAEMAKLTALMGGMGGSGGPPRGPDGRYIAGAGGGGAAGGAPGGGRGGWGKFGAGLGIGAAGMYAYGRARQVGGAAFAGTSGLAQALGAIPIVGGFMAGQVNAMMGTAGAGLAALGQRQQMMGMMNMPGMLAAEQAARAGARGRAASDAQLRRRAQGAANAQYRSTIRSTPIALDGEWNPALIDEVTGELVGMKGDQAREAAVGGGHVNAASMRGALANKAQREAGKAYDLSLAKGRSQRASEIAAAGRRARNSEYSRLQRATSGVGMDPAARRQFIMQVAGGAGGLTQDMGSYFLQSAAAASRMGVSSGALSQFQRVQNMGGGDAAMNLSKAMSDALRVGLTGSDRMRYVERIARTLASFEQTGIPVKAESVARTQGAFSAMFGAQRGGVLTDQLLQGARGISQSGPQSGLQFQALRMLGGYDPSKGFDSYYDALERMESGNFVEGGLANFANFSMRGYTGKRRKAAGLRSAMSAVGVQLGLGEARKAAAGDMSGVQQIEEARKIAAAEREAGGFDRVARKATSGALKAQEGIAATNEATGLKMISVLQQLERTQAKTLRTFSKLQPELLNAAEGLGSIAKTGSTEIVSIIERIKALIVKAEESRFIGG